MISSLERKMGLFLILSLLLNIYLMFFKGTPYRRENHSIISIRSRSNNTKMMKDNSPNPNANTNANNINKNHTVYAHVHMAKTAGTDINVKLAHHFERVCGHKGYSYDSYQVNERVASMIAKNGGAPINVLDMSDSITKSFSYHSRGRVPPTVMSEIGFEDCDWVSIEENWVNWEKILPWSIYKQHNMHVEYHVPCRRDPLQHLMSQCNIKDIRFDCEAEDLQAEIQMCVDYMNRFSFNLTQQPESKSWTTLKCFDAIPPDAYVNYMSTKLQTKRIVNMPSLMHRETNTPRNASKECIWGENAAFQEKIRQLMYGMEDYYQFCRDCFETGKYALF